MAYNFYTSFHMHKGKLLLRGIEDDQPVMYKIPVQPYLFIKSASPKAEYRTLFGKPVDKVEFENTNEAWKFVEQNKNIHGFEIYGMRQYEYPYINDHYQGQIDYDSSKIKVGWFDIENAGSLDVVNTPAEITTLSIMADGIYHAFGTKPWEPEDVIDENTGKVVIAANQIVYYHCRDESHLLHSFLDLWQKLKLDCIVGWNNEKFDIPYLVNRMSLVIGADQVKKLSPWGIIEQKMIRIPMSNKEALTYIIYGINNIDYLELYKKFSFKMQENYKLNTIAHVTLGEKKLDYSDFEGLQGLYKNDFAKFMRYNLKDVNLVVRIDEKEGLLNQVFALAYDGKVTFSDTLTTVRMWDVITHNYLNDKKIVVPDSKVRDFIGELPGGYVKEPIPSGYDWVVSCDLTSLYPKLIEQYNISPETLRHKTDHLNYPSMWTPDSAVTHVNQLLDGAVNRFRDELEKDNLTLSASGHTFTRDFKGFIPELMERIFNDRAKYKKSMIDAEKDYEKSKDPKYLPDIARFKNLQMAKKIQLNSLYGALGNQYFRWFDLRLAESVTLSGQLSIRWVAKKVNEWMNNLCHTKDVDYIVAIDTDSVYITFAEYVKQQGYEKDLVTATVDMLDKFCKAHLVPFIARAYEELGKYMNVYEQKMEMKREVIANKGVWTAKKRYILNVWDSEGVRYQEPKLKVMGLEAVRSSVPEICRTNIKKAYGIIMNGTEEELQKFIADFRTKFRALPFEDVAYPRGVNGTEKYSDRNTIYKKRTPIHVRGALLYNNIVLTQKLQDQFPLIEDGDKIRFCYLKMPNTIHENVIACPDALPRQFDLNRFIDYDKQFEKTIIEPLTVILNLVGWSVEKRMSLDMFWS